jgi:hypothetical protein
MNREKALQISNQIKQAIEKIAAENQLQFNTEKISFTNCSMNINISIIETNNQDFEKSMTMLSKKYGFTQNIIGMEFSCSNGDFIIESFKVQNRKYPILAKRKLDGASFKFHPKNVLKYLGGDNIVNRNANLKNLFG